MTKWKKATTVECKEKEEAKRIESITIQELNDIAVLPEIFQHREKLRENAVKEYTIKYKNKEVFPPITVAQIENGLFLIDGFHRIAALKRLHELELPDYIDIEVIKCKNTDEARWLGTQQNMRHGVPLTRKERKNVFDVYVAARQYWKVYRKKYKSFREVARELGVTHKTVSRWMKEEHRNIWLKMIGKEGNDMTDVDTMGENDQPSLVYTAIDNFNDGYKATQGLKTKYEKMAVVTHLREILNSLTRETEALLEPGEELSDIAPDF